MTTPELAGAAVAVPSSAGLHRRAALGALALTLIACSAADAGGDDAVSLDTARADLQAGRAVLIDIREPDEHATGVAPGARLLPLQQLERRLDEIPKDPNQPVLLICHTQGRSSKTLKALRERGWTNVHYVQGGMSEWAKRGWPLVKPKE